MYYVKYEICKILKIQKTNKSKIVMQAQFEELVCKMCESGDLVLRLEKLVRELREYLQSYMQIIVS